MSEVMTPYCSAHDEWLILTSYETQSGEICICGMERYIINVTSLNCQWMLIICVQDN